MKGFFILIAAIICSLILVPFNVVHADTHSLKTPHILILKSKDSSYYNKTINVIKKAFANTLTIKNIKDNPLKNDAQIIISLGIKAAEYSRLNFPDSRKILTFITAQQSLNLGLKKNETHLLIEQNPQKYIEFTKIVLPNKNIGILFQKNTYEFLTSSEENVSFFEVTKQSNVILITRKAIKNADVLLALPNKKIYNRLSLKGILLSTFQNGTPLISYSPAHVKAGALAAIYASPLNLAQQITETINIIKTSNKIQHSRQYAKYYSIRINRRVARSLALNLPSNLKILLEMENSH